MSTKKVTWYEKTVEYAFARKFLEAAAMPLSGTAEKVGDTIFYEGNSFFIIEFKRGLDEKKEKKDEQKKYLNITESVKRILKHEACMSHYVVWGYVDEKQKFGLKAQYYINFIAEEYLDYCLNKYKEFLAAYEKDLEEVEKCFEKPLKQYDLDKDIKDFLYGYQNGYLRNKLEPWQLTSTYTGFCPIGDLEKLKNYLQLLINEKKSSSNDSSSVDYGNILIVDKDGNACALSDKECLQKLDLKFPTDTPSSTSSFSFGM
jgi:identified by metaGeneAnnotator|nr:hypothetical protein [uncultured Neisseria sp.]